MTSMCRHWAREATQRVAEHVIGTKGSSTCRDMGKDDINPYVQEHMNLLAAVRGDAPYINEGVQCAESTMTAIMGRMSAYTGMELTWDEALNSDLSIVPEVISFDEKSPVGEVPNPGPKMA